MSQTHTNPLRHTPSPPGTAVSSQEDYTHGVCKLKQCAEHTFSETRSDWVECKGGHGYHMRGVFRSKCHLCYGSLTPQTRAFYRSKKTRSSAPFSLADTNFHVPSVEARESGSIRTPLRSHHRGIPLTGRHARPIPPPDAPAPVTPFLPTVTLNLSVPVNPPTYTYFLNRESSTSSIIPLPNMPNFSFAHDAPYPDGRDCLLRAVETSTGIDRHALWARLRMSVPWSELTCAYVGKGLSTFHLHILCLCYDWKFFLKYPQGASGHFPLVGKTDSPNSYAIQWEPTKSGGHFTPVDQLVEAAHYSYVFSKPDVTMTHAHGTGAEQFRKTILNSLRSVPDLTWQSWTPSRERAKKFWNAYQAHEVGIQFNEVFVRSDRIPSTPSEITRGLELWQPRPIQLGVVCGLPGSGKSRPIINRLIQNKDLIAPSLFAFGFPRVFLRTETVNKFNFSPEDKAKKDCFRTWEHVLSNDQLLGVYDEYTLYPPGYFDFVCYNASEIENLLLLGDPSQGNWSPESENARANSTLLSLPTNKAVFSHFCNKYRYYSYRIPGRIAAPFNIHSLSSNYGWVDYQVHLPPLHLQYPLLCPSDTIKAAHKREGWNAYTYTEVQGAEFPIVVLKVTEATLLACSLESIWTAMTRATEGLIIQSDLDLSRAGSLAIHPLFGPLLDHAPPRSLYDLFIHTLAPNAKLILPPTLQHVSGTGVDRPADVLCNWTNSRLDYLPPSFKANAPVIYESFCADYSPSNPSPTEPGVRTHLPKSCDPNSFLELEPSLPREERELVYRGEMSKQFQEYTRKGALSVAANFFPRQAAKEDPTLFASAVKTRFDYKTPEYNLQDYERKRWLGPMLFERFRSYLNLPGEGFQFDEDRYLLSLVQTIAVKLDKPINTIWNNIDRSEPEWEQNFMHAFVKSQHKAKAETGARQFRLYEDDDSPLNKPLAKPGQPLVTSPDINVFRFGAWTRYMRSLIYEHMPKNIYIHGGKTLHQLDSFSRTYSNDQDASTCDFTKYDMSCKAETLSFELCLFSYFGLDVIFPDLVNDYFFIKTHMYTQLGTSGIMRFTGEFGTYDFNSWYNIAYMAFRFKLNPLDTRGSAFSGDDSIFFFKLIERPDWDVFSKYFSLIGKLFIGPSKDFCGWWLLPCGAVRNPILLCLKIMYQRDRGNLDKCLDSYFLEAIFAHNHGDALFEHVPPLALEAQSWVINFCFKYSHLVPHLRLISSSDPIVINWLDPSSIPDRVLKQLFPRLSLLSFLPRTLLNLN